MSDQTKIRLAMLDMGYQPLPNHDKRCMKKDWNSFRVDREAIESWSDKLIYKATGLRLVPGLCAFDVDVNDADFVGDLWAAATDEVPALRDALIRFGKGYKEMWLFRVAPSFGIMNSTTHVMPDEDPENCDIPTHRVEVFGGDSGRQFGVYGAHTVGPKGEALIRYEWMDDRGPAEVPFDELPVLSKDDVIKLLDIANEMFVGRNWPRVMRIKAGEVSEPTVYDLTDDMAFDCDDGVTRSLSELKAYAQTRSPRCSASWLEGPQARNTKRCLVSLSHDGQPAVYETANAQTHLPVKVEEVPFTDKLAALAGKLQRQGFELPTDIEENAPDEFKQTVQDLLNEYAYCQSRARNCLPIEGDEEESCTIANLRARYAAIFYETEGPRGGVKRHNPVDTWLTHPERKNAIGYRFMPHYGPGIQLDDEGQHVINSYRAPPELLVPVGPRIQDEKRQLWLDLLEHLLPDHEERAWLMDWLAHKYQRPNVAGVGVLMVARTHGTGRGSLFELLQHVFGQRYVKPLSAQMLLGEGSQTQYTDWQGQSLLATVDEVLQDGDDGGVMAWKRRKAYEKLKERVDPKARRITIVRKGLPSYTDTSYTSYLMATNHPNALPLDAKDRRIAVLTNSDTDLISAPNDLYRRLNDVRDYGIDPAQIAVIRDMLARHRWDADFSPYVAPKFIGRQRMIEQNESPFDNIVRDVLEALPLDWVTQTAFEKRVEKELTRQDMKGEIRNWRVACLDLLRQQWLHGGRLNVDTKRKRSMVYFRSSYMMAVFDDYPLTKREAELRILEDVNQLPTPELIAARAGLRTVK